MTAFFEICTKGLRVQVLADAEVKWVTRLKAALKTDFETFVLRILNVILP